MIVVQATTRIPLLLGEFGSIARKLSPTPAAAEAINRSVSFWKAGVDQANLQLKIKALESTYAEFKNPRMSKISEGHQLFRYFNLVTDTRELLSKIAPNNPIFQKLGLMQIDLDQQKQLLQLTPAEDKWLKEHFNDKEINNNPMYFKVLSKRMMLAILTPSNMRSTPEYQAAKDEAQRLLGILPSVFVTTDKVVKWAMEHGYADVHRLLRPQFKAL